MYDKKYYIKIMELKIPMILISLGLSFIYCILYIESPYYVTHIAYTDLFIIVSVLYIFIYNISNFFAAHFYVDYLKNKQKSYNVEKLDSILNMRRKFIRISNYTIIIYTIFHAIFQIYLILNNYSARWRIITSLYIIFILFLSITDQFIKRF